MTFLGVCTVLEDHRKIATTEFDGTLVVNIELINTKTGDEERTAAINNHDVIVGLVERFARRQHISTRAVDVRVSPRSRSRTLNASNPGEQT